MSEFMEKHSVSRLIGAPPGYIGYDEGGILTEAVRRMPYSVVLLDEVEKAHPDIFNVLLQVLDDGRMTDGHGRTVDFKNTVIVMTSNLGSRNIQNMVGTQSQEIKAEVLKEVNDFFRPEFINRIDEAVVFHSLGEEHMHDIVRIQLKALRDRLEDSGFFLYFGEDVVRLIVNVGFDKAFGARPLKRAIQTKIENPLAKKIIEGNYVKNDSILLSSESGEVKFGKEGK